jgi:hypothetical protein
MLIYQKGDTPLDWWEIFGDFFPHDQYPRESSVLSRQGHLIAV